MAEPLPDDLIVRGIVVGSFAENCWVIGSRSTREGIVIDPGAQPEEILAMVKDMDLEVKLIANTHAHIDHVMGVRGVQEATGAKFLLHSQEAASIQGAAGGAARWMGGAVDPPPEPDVLLSDGDEVEVEGVTLQVIHTPGHTPGGVCFYTEGVLFSGDTLFRGSIGRTDMPGGSYEQLMAGIVDRLLVLPDDTVVLPGHMDETQLGIERRTNPFVQQELAQRGSG
jgi:glyoxylase-like metal-dependent hydrolase (beta-lactamase superfamily II)